MPPVKKYTVAIYGTGKRGKVHAETFHKDGRFDVVALSGRNRERLDAAAQLAGNPKKYLDAAEMLREVKPDVFCFCTPPAVRLSISRTVQQFPLASTMRSPTRGGSETSLCGKCHTTSLRK